MPKPQTHDPQDGGEKAMIGPIDIRCTWCNAKPGSPCTTRIGRDTRMAVDFHPERRGEAKWIRTSLSSCIGPPEWIRKEWQRRGFCTAFESDK